MHAARNIHGPSYAHAILRTSELLVALRLTSSAFGEVGDTLEAPVPVNSGPSSRSDA
jgi:hypothetical protein